VKVNVSPMVISQIDMAREERRKEWEYGVVKNPESPPQRKVTTTGPPHIAAYFLKRIGKPCAFYIESSAGTYTSENS